MKQTRTNQITAGLFLLIGVIYALLNNIYIGGIFIVAGTIFLVLSLRKQPNKAELTPEQREEVEKLIKRGEQVEAVKRVRTLSRAGLLEAKTYVDALEERSRTGREDKPKKKRKNKVNKRS